MPVPGGDAPPAVRGRRHPHPRGRRPRRRLAVLGHEPRPGAVRLHRGDLLLEDRGHHHLDDLPAAGEPQALVAAARIGEQRHATHVEVRPVVALAEQLRHAVDRPLRARAPREGVHRAVGVLREPQRRGAERCGRGAPDHPGRLAAEGRIRRPAAQHPDRGGEVDRLGGTVDRGGVRHPFGGHRGDHRHSVGTSSDPARTDTPTLPGMGRIRWLLFDVGGVLERVDDDAWPVLLPRAVRRPGGPRPRRSSTARTTAAALPDITTRSGAEEDYWSGFGAAIGADAAALAEIREDFWDAYCGTANQALLGEARSLVGRIGLAILSNSGDGARREEERRYGFSRVFDPILYSHETGVSKPDPRAFEIALTAMGADAGEVLFLDDQRGQHRGRAGPRHPRASAPGRRGNAAGDPRGRRDSGHARRRALASRHDQRTDRRRARDAREAAEEGHGSPSSPR